jgi:hypothetical protein
VGVHTGARGPVLASSVLDGRSPTAAAILGGRRRDLAGGGQVVPWYLRLVLRGLGGDGVPARHAAGRRPARRREDRRRPRAARRRGRRSPRPAAVAGPSRAPRPPTTPRPSSQPYSPGAGGRASTLPARSPLQVECEQVLEDVLLVADPLRAAVGGAHGPVEDGVVVREPRPAGVVEVGEGQLLQLRLADPSGFGRSPRAGRGGRRLRRWPRPAGPPPSPRRRTPGAARASPMFYENPTNPTPRKENRIDKGDSGFYSRSGSHLRPDTNPRTRHRGRSGVGLRAVCRVPDGKPDIEYRLSNAQNGGRCRVCRVSQEEGRLRRNGGSLLLVLAVRYRGETRTRTGDTMIFSLARDVSGRCRRLHNRHI